jgi:N-acetylglucosamine-6-sulfatase
MMTRRLRAQILATAALLAGAMVASSSPTTAFDAARVSRTGGIPAIAPVETEPNIIFFLADDLATYHLPHMPNTRRFIFRQGARFTNYYANIGLCCPSRVSLLTGKYAHNTGVGGNSFPDGFHGFHVGDESSRTVAISLRRRAGYTTGLLGKYLNEYPFVESSPSNAVRRTFVPPGWADWAVPIKGQYYGTDYLLNVNGRIKHKFRPRDYLGDLLTRRAIRKIDRNRDRRRLMLVLSSYGPHMPEPASPTEKNDAVLNARIARLAFPRTPDFNEADVSDKPRHIRRLRRLTRAQQAEVDRIYRRQLVSLATIDRHVGEVVQALRRTDQLSNTYLVFSSDNGYHMGNHRLPIGKNTPYLSDLRVPLGIRGPGIAPGTIVRDLTGTIDVAPTFADMAGIELPYLHDGESLLPLAQGAQPETWRRFFLVQRGSVGDVPSRVAAEPARLAEQRAARLITGWRGVVTQRWQYARYRNGDEELYDGSVDPHQLHNILARPLEEQTPEQRQAHDDLQEALEQLSGCAGPTNCRLP